MILKPPFRISARLMPALKIGKAWISIGYRDDGAGSDGRRRYIAHFDGVGRPHTDTALKSGVGGGTLQEGMQSLLAFLSAAAESRQYRKRAHQKGRGENEDLFPSRIVTWAAENSDEIAMLQYEISETPGLIEEGGTDA